MKKILLVLFFAIIASLIFTTCNCNDSKPKKVEQADEMSEEEVNFEDNDEDDSDEIELDSSEEDENEEDENQ